MQVMRALMVPHSLNPNVAKAGGLQRQGAKGIAVQLLQKLGNAGYEVLWEYGYRPIKTGNHALNTAGSMAIDPAAFKGIEYS